MLRHSDAIAKVKGSLILDPAAIDRLLSSRGVPMNYFVSNDDNAYLEYSTPKGNVLDGVSSMNSNLKFLGTFSDPGRTLPK